MFTVHIYPYSDSGHHVAFVLKTKEDADKFVDHINTLYDGQFLSGGEANGVYAVEIEAVDYEQAVEELVERIGPSEED